MPNPGANFGSLSWLWWPNATAQAFLPSSQLAYAAKHRIPEQELKRAMAHVSVKSHANGALNPKAHLRKAITEDQAMAAPIIAHPLGLFDCCGVSDGSACAIVTTVERAKEMGKKELVTGQVLAARAQQRRGNGVSTSGRAITSSPPTPVA